MEDTKDKLLPGTVTVHSAQGAKGFSKIEMLLEATGGLSLSQVCAVTGLEGSTIQNWVKRGWVSHPKGKKYEEIHIARILIINALKECIKLEHIAQLMTYVNGETSDSRDDIIKESNLYNYLCAALQQLGRVDDLSRGGVEALVDKAIKDYNEPSQGARLKIRKVLTVMIYACVCTDVKRRTESMLEQVLFELDNPDAAVAVPVETETKPIEIPVARTTAPTKLDTLIEQATGGDENRRTVAQALREWDLSKVEDILKEDEEIEVMQPVVETQTVIEAEEETPPEVPEKPAPKPWYFRRN